MRLCHRQAARVADRWFPRQYQGLVASKSDARALTAAPACGKLIPLRFGEALTLRLSPEGDLFKRQRGATFGPPLLLTTMASSSFPGAASSPFDPLHAIEELAAISIRSRSSSGQPQQLHSRFFANPHFLQNQCEGAPRRTGMEKPEPWLLNPNARGGTLRQSRALRSHCDV